MINRIILMLIIILSTVFLLISCGHEHEYSEWKTAKPSTCTEKGYWERVCECGATDTAPIDMLEHEIEIIEPILATCTENGSTGGSFCKLCGIFTEKPELIPASHKYDTSEIETPPTCEDIGKRTFVCTVCGELASESIRPLGHDYTDATCISPKECRRCFKTEGEALGHTSVTGTCGRCNQTIMPTIILPNCPIERHVIWKGNSFSSMSITDISYSYNEFGDIIFTLSGEKLTDTTESAPYYSVGFSYRLYDDTGLLVSNGNFIISNLGIGEVFKEKTFTVISSELTEGCMEYTLKIENYVFIG